ncbi:MAG: hypothetical protein IJH88_05840 [Eggerthellaceae bacterium]|nr:hypothetical protein [Eggerthellaceae bacterium]
MQVVEERLEATITQRVLAYAKTERMDFEALLSTIGLNSMDISNLQQGKRTLTAEEYVMLCEFLGASPSTFIRE